jgi:putative transposase
MRKSKFSEHQIIAILKAVEAGRTVKDVCREHEISDATYYQWKSKYGGMQASDIKRLRELEDENRRLKQISADLLLENRVLSTASFHSRTQSKRSRRLRRSTIASDRLTPDTSLAY